MCSGYPDSNNSPTQVANTLCSQLIGNPVLTINDQVNMILYIQPALYSTERLIKSEESQKRAIIINIIAMAVL